MNESRRQRNVATGTEWSFAFDDASRDLSRWVVFRLEAVAVTGDIVNDGTRLGTAYVRVQFAESHLVPTAYVTGPTLYDSHSDIARRAANRIVDIAPGERRRWSTRVTVPPEARLGHYDFQIEIWNPPKLYGTQDDHMFYRSETFGGFEVLPDMPFRPEFLTFISYSHESTSHEKWVVRLFEELSRAGVPCRLDARDAAVGSQFASFMTDGIGSAPVVVVVCSDNYADKADRRAGGVGYEMAALESRLKDSSSPPLIIPVYRENKRGRLPISIAGLKGIDMGGDDWQRAPLQELVDAIRSRGSRS